jgi:hypothetical protein
MKSNIKILDRYLGEFRDLVNSVVWRNLSRPIKESLKLSEESEWNFLCASMDIAGDASTAIAHFLRFGLDGPTRYDDVGEKYLRLYGLLSATYIQQQATYKICKLVNVPTLKAIAGTFNALEIRELRHKLASHGTDFSNKSKNSIEAFAPIRMGIGGMAVDYSNFTGKSEQHSVNLKEAINAHCTVVTDALDTAMSKAINTLYKGHRKKITEWNERLDTLRIERKGGSAIKHPDGETVVIALYGAL